MWFVYDTSITRLGIISETTLTMIEHNYNEADTLELQVPYTEENISFLKEGRILHRGKERKAFRIHSLQVEEENKSIIANAYGLEGVLENRVLNDPTEFKGTPEQAIYHLVNLTIINPNDPRRKIDEIKKASPKLGGTKEEYAWLGEGLYETVSAIAKEHRFGFAVHFNVEEKNLEFEVYVGTDRSVNQQAVQPIIWRSDWGDTRHGLLLQSVKESKNTMYIQSGDEDYSIRWRVGAEWGWDRREGYIVASDVTRNMFPDNEKPLTANEIRSFLISRGKTELSKLNPLDDYMFTINEDVPEVYGVDYFEGDIVTVINDEFGIAEDKRITKVKETIYQNTSRFEILFEKEQEWVE